MGVTTPQKLWTEARAGELGVSSEMKNSLFFI